MYLKTGEPLDEDRMQARYMRRRGRGAPGCGGDKGWHCGMGEIYYSERHRGRQRHASWGNLGWGATTAGIVGMGRQWRELWGLWAEGGKTFTRFSMSNPCPGEQTSCHRDGCAVHGGRAGEGRGCMMRCSPSPDSTGWTEACSIMQGDEGLCLHVKRMHGLAGRQSPPAPNLGVRVRGRHQSGSGARDP